jgi:probable rRNA maturation factor
MILNRQKKVRLAVRPLVAFLGKIQRELRLENRDVSIAFVSDEEIARWNERYRRKKGPTDVLSFPAGALLNGAARRSAGHRRRNSPAAITQFLGDIAIAPETARRYAKKNGRSMDAEIRVLILHGVLHLMGYDHESDNGQMNQIEQRLRRRLGIS